MSNFSSSRRYNEISTSRAPSTVKMACLRSSVASTSAAPNLARNLLTKSLSRGVCSTTGGLGGAGTAPFGGTTSAPASPGLAGGTQTTGLLAWGFFTVWALGGFEYSVLPALVTGVAM